jgi:hypothetical protein
MDGMGECLTYVKHSPIIHTWSRHGVETEKGNRNMTTQDQVRKLWNELEATETQWMEAKSKRQAAEALRLRREMDKVQKALDAIAS